MAAWVGGLPWGVCQHSIPAESNAPYSIPLHFTGLLVSPTRSLAKGYGGQTDARDICGQVPLAAPTGHVALDRNLPVPQCLHLNNVMSLQ